MDPYSPEGLIAVADGSPAEVVTRLAALDPVRVLAAPLTEVGSRASVVLGPPHPVPVQFDLRLPGGGRVSAVLSLGPGVRSVGLGELRDPIVTIRQDLDELLRAVYGPPGGAEGTREVRVRVPDIGAPPAPGAPQGPWGALVAHQVLAALERRPVPLTELAVRFGADKWGDHWYARHYERYFAPYRERRVRILEIGIGGYDQPGAGGASLRMWKHWFPRGLVWGLDLHDKSQVDEPRIATVIGSQTDVELLARLGAEVGPFDLILDDGSHAGTDIETSFHALWPWLRPGGLYAVEDLHTAYWPAWTRGLEPGGPGTAIGLIHALVDGLHHQERAGVEPSAEDLGVSAVHVHHNLVVIEKGGNTEQGGPAWIRDAAAQ